LQLAINEFNRSTKDGILLNRIEGKNMQKLRNHRYFCEKAVEKQMSQALASLRKEIEEL
jgi:hypothetical protein